MIVRKTQHHSISVKDVDIKVAHAHLLASILKNTDDPEKFDLTPEGREVIRALSKVPEMSLFYLSNLLQIDINDISECIREE